jgi:hypothetical protein
MRVFLVLIPLTGVAATCISAMDCSLNGVCSSGMCSCDSPWTGMQCESLTYSVTPAGAKNIWVGANTSVCRRVRPYPRLRHSRAPTNVTPLIFSLSHFSSNETLNTWNGPILRDSSGVYHGKFTRACSRPPDEHPSTQPSLHLVPLNQNSVRACVRARVPLGHTLHRARRVLLAHGPFRLDVKAQPARARHQPRGAVVPQRVQPHRLHHGGLSGGPDYGRGQPGGSLFGEPVDVPRRRRLQSSTHFRKGRRTLHDEPRNRHRVDHTVSRQAVDHVCDDSAPPLPLHG